MSTSAARTLIVRYESNNWFTEPFEIGLRHFKLATCNGSQENLFLLAKERIIYRPCETNNTYKKLTTETRVYHFIVGALETVGYLTLIVPFITVVVDRFCNKPRCWKGSDELRTHVEEGGIPGEAKANWRKNPFDADGRQDPFYQGASWIQSTQSAFA